MLDLFDRLEMVNPSMRPWTLVADAPIPVIHDQKELARQIVEITEAAEIGGGIAVTAYSPACTARMTLGMAAPSGLMNSVNLMNPSKDVQQAWVHNAYQLITTLVEVFDPDWAVIGSQSHRKAQPRPDRPTRPWIGAVTFSKDFQHVGDVQTKVWADGEIIDLTTNGSRLPTTIETSRVQRQMFSD
jgi:hypothetical protein